jgi:hypothetical protein
MVKIDFQSMPLCVYQSTLSTLSVAPLSTREVVLYLLQDLSLDNNALIQDNGFALRGNPKIAYRQ